MLQIGADSRAVCKKLSQALSKVICVFVPSCVCSHLHHYIHSNNLDIIYEIHFYELRIHKNPRRRIVDKKAFVHHIVIYARARGSAKKSISYLIC